MVDQPPRELADEDLVRSGRLLEPSCDADDLAGDEPLSCIRLSGDDLARLETDPYLEPDSVLFEELRV